MLEFEHVTGKGHKFHLKDIHFTLPAGYIMGLVGANGAGKTTLINYIMSEGVKYEGSIRVGGVDIRENHAYMKNQIGFVSEDNLFLEDRTAKGNAQLLGIFYEHFDMDIFKEAMKEMGLPMECTYGKMSRGEKLKFQMAFAMAHQPKIYLLDEVTVGMDPVFRMDFFKILQKVIEKEEASVLMTSHIMSEIQQKTDFVGILKDGRLVQFGESLDVMTQMQKGD
ncbi:MAG: ABC transporter ATP-binding protein [Lachnospiraceae bacterium]|nr:ABC transporter ATP-binding protein [Lachnospiraceae bacterium]